MAKTREPFYRPIDIIGTEPLAEQAGSFIPETLLSEVDHEGKSALRGGFGALSNGGWRFGLKVG